MGRVTAHQASSSPPPTRRRASGSGRRSEASENYLLSLRILQEDGIAPHLTELAAYLRHLPAAEGVGTTLASVSGMVQRMSREGLLRVDENKRVVLTNKGAELAHDVVRRHRLSERLLVDILDVPLERAETEAHRLEHSISPDLLRQIEEKLGYPETCPYGRPIDRAGAVGPRPYPSDVVRLRDVSGGTQFSVVRIPDEDYPLLKFLVDSGVLPGRLGSALEVACYRGVVDLQIGDGRISLGLEVASRILVRPISPQAT